MAAKLIDKLLAEADEVKENLVEQIDEAIAKIEKRMAPYEALNAKKQQLLASRRALLGQGNRVTGSGGPRITQEMVVDYLRRYPYGMTSHQIADGINGSEGAVRAHLNRGKDERFLKHDDGRWFLRDPKNGINTVEDLPEGTEDDDD
jgi:hypothetical protein